jgi:hypothetical protein
MVGHRISVYLLMSMAAALTAVVSLQAQEYVREAGPALLSYNELVELGSDQEMTPELAEKLHLITDNPICQQ